MVNTVIEIGIPGFPGLPGDLGRAVDLGTKAGALDLSTYGLGTQVFRLVTGASNLTLAPAGMPVIPPTLVGSFTLRITQGATPRTLTFDPAIKSSFGNDPVLTTSAGAIDLLTFLWTGVEWVALLSGAALA